MEPDPQGQAGQEVRCAQHDSHGQVGKERQLRREDTRQEGAHDDPHGQAGLNEATMSLAEREKSMNACRDEEQFRG